MLLSVCSWLCQSLYGLSAVLATLLSDNAGIAWYVCLGLQHGVAHVCQVQQHLAPTPIATI